MLSLLSLIEGITTLSIIIFGSCMGLYFYYKARKLNVNLLSYLGLMIFLAGISYMGTLYDFLTILVTGTNMDNSNGLLAILCYMWAPPVLVLGLYIGAQLLIPEKKLYFLFVFLIIGIICEIIIFLDPMNNFVFIYPDILGEEIIEDMLVSGTLLSALLLLLGIATYIFLVFGCFIKSRQSKGIIRRKYLYLSIGFLLFNIFGALDGFIFLKIAVIFVRIGAISSFLFLYLGLKEEPEKPKKMPSDKEIKIEESIFRISKRPEQITEEEVSFHKEKKICLVCKGKVGGFMYMCSKCGALYCGKCSQALINLENACWACNTAIDESKPVKLLEDDDEITAKKLNDLKK